MIAESEIRRFAARWQVDPMVVDLDYGLGWFLIAFHSAGQVTQSLRFKGGTCLRKCYFPDYRFSEDLDFTAEAYLAPQHLLEAIQRATRWSIDHDGPDFVALPPRLEVVEDEYGRESYQVRIYYRGPLRWSGTPRAIRVDVTRDEQLLLPAESRRVLHPYSDSATLPEVALACYPLEEILAEKIRALGGQRRFAISRDLYDIHQLVQAGVIIERVKPLLPAKFAARGIDLSSAYVDRLVQRRNEFEQDWRHKLAYLIASTVSFEAAWTTSINVLRQSLPV